jgi:hypothetical protein
MNSKGRGDGDPMRMGGSAAHEDCPVVPEHPDWHAGAVRAAVLLRRQVVVVPVRLQVRGHAGGAARGGCSPSRSPSSSPSSCPTTRSTQWYYKYYYL